MAHTPRDNIPKSHEEVLNEYEPQSNSEDRLVPQRARRHLPAVTPDGPWLVSSDSKQVLESRTAESQPACPAALVRRELSYEHRNRRSPKRCHL
jgi:hypothetical protein